MPQYIAFLRGMNLGNRRIKMDELRRHFEALKFAGVETFIASGNVLFSSKTGDSRKLAASIESHLAQVLGYSVDTFVRTRGELAAVAKFQPFASGELSNSGNTIHVGFWNDPPSRAQRDALVACRTDVDELCVKGREFYWLCRIKTNESKVWTSPQMKAVPLPSCTMRNMTTIRKMVTLFPSS